MQEMLCILLTCSKLRSPRIRCRTCPGGLGFIQKGKTGLIVQVGKGNEEFSSKTTNKKDDLQE